MKIFLPRFFLWLLMATAFSTGYAQCPGILTINAASVTHASCPDNGSVTLGGSGVGNAAVTYKIVSGPSHTGAQQSSHIFNSLSAGVYTFRATCNAQTADVIVTINNDYTPVNPNFSISVGDVCQYFTPGGSITITGVSGGSAPLQYSFIKNNAANYDDALSAYGASNSYSATSWGTYQVRVKDACGIFVTRTINIEPLYPPATFSGASVELNGVPCDSARLWFWLMDDNGESISLSGYPKLRFNIFEKSGTSGCVKGALFKSLELLSTDDETFIIPKRDMVIEVVTPCGDTRVNCYNYPDNDSLQTFWQPLINGCGTVADPYTFSIRHQYNNYSKTPITIKLYDNTTNTLLQTVNSNTNYNAANFTALALNDYRIEVTDACGNADTLIITPPVGTPGISPVDYGTYVDKECTYEDGKVTVKLGITGLVSNINTSTITITSGPDNIGTSASSNTSNGLYYFYTLTPGATYGFNLNNGCSITPLTFTVPTDSWRIVNFTMNPVVTQQCGGAGTINTNIVWTGWGLRRSELWQGATKISENNSGVYTNVPPGTYTIKGIAEMTWCSNTTYKEITDVVTVLSNGTVPQVLRKYAFICEDAFGVAGSTGKATIEIAGFGPFKYDIKRISPSPQATYTNVATNAPALYTFDNLDAYAVYNVLITDNCGKSTVTEVVVSNIGTLTLETNNNPCNGSPYLLSVQDIPGATYSWIKDGSAIQLSNTRNLYFANYNAAYNGKYICTVVLDGACIERAIAVNISSDFCLSVLPVNLRSFQATPVNCSVKILWTAAEAYNGKYMVEKSVDGAAYRELAYVNAVGNQLSYETVDYNPSEGDNYYRIKMVDENGKFGYATTVIANNVCGVQKATGINLYPNPLSGNNLMLLITTGRASVGSVNVINAFGQVLMTKQVTLLKGDNRIALSLGTLPKGTYVLKVIDDAGTLGNMKLVKQ
jgi:hypothetical protein